MSWFWSRKSPRDQSKPEVSPLEQECAASNHISSRQTTSGLVRGTEAWARGMATPPWPTRQAQDGRGFEQRYSDSAISVSITGTAIGISSMTLDTNSQGVKSDRENSHLYDAELHTAGSATQEDQAQCRAPSPSREMQKSKRWKQLRTKRRQLQDIRILYEEQREALRIKEHERHAIDTQFIRKLQKVESVALEDMRDFVMEILRHYKILQQARSGVAFEEGQYERIERQLVETERELQDLESHVYRSTTTESVAFLARHDDPMPVDEDPTESVVSSQNIRRNQSVEAQRYLSQKGNVDILKEQLMDLRVYQSQVTVEQADRCQAGLDPDEALTAFLDGFDLQQEALVLRVRDAEDLLIEYEDALQVPEDSYSPSEGRSRANSLLGPDDYFDPSILEASEMKDDRLAATATAFLSHPSDSDSVYGLLENVLEDEPIDKALYINSWLLHHLRSSTGQMAELVAELLNYGIQLEPSDFEEKVLANWLQDDTIHAFDFSRAAVGSHDYSVATVSGKTQNSRPASENALHSDQQNDLSLQRRLSARQTQTER